MFRGEWLKIRLKRKILLLAYKQIPLIVFDFFLILARKADYTLNPEDQQDLFEEPGIEFQEIFCFLRKEWFEIITVIKKERGFIISSFN